MAQGMSIVKAGILCLEIEDVGKSKDTDPIELDYCAEILAF